MFSCKVHEVSLGPVGSSSKAAKGRKFQVLWKTSPPGLVMILRIPAAWHTPLPFIQSYAHGHSLAFLHLKMQELRRDLLTDLPMLPTWVGCLLCHCTVDPTCSKETVCCQMPKELCSIWVWEDFTDFH